MTSASHGRVLCCVTGLLFLWSQFIFYTASGSRQPLLWLLVNCNAELHMHQMFLLPVGLVKLPLIVI